MTRSLHRILLTLAVVLLGFALASGDADAKRLGGGRSIGKQSSNVTQRDAQPHQSPAQQQQAAPNPAQGNPATAPQAPRNRWLGPLGGLAAGLGIAALLSHFGLGAGLAEALGSMLLIAALVIAGLFVFRMLRGGGAARAPQPAYAGAGTPLRREMPEPVPLAPAGGAGVSVTGRPLAPLGGEPQPVAATWSVPAGFDTEAFVRTAKVHFVRLQAAWDAGDLDDIREFTTPEMFAEIKLDLADRGTTKNQTDVLEVDAQLLGIEEQGRSALASVRFTGQLREAPDAAPTAFAEVWNLTKPLAGKVGWLLAGIQQENAA